MTNFRGWLLNLITPFVKWWGGLHLPYTHKLLTGRHYYSLNPRIFPGIIFLTKIRGEASNLLIPGPWTHAAIYYKNERVLEAIGKGVVETDLVSFLTSKDYVLALVPLFLGDKWPEVMVKAANIAREQVGKPYDFAFEFSPSENKAFYCSELVWYAYLKATATMGLTCPFTPRMSLGSPTVTPSDIALAKEKFEIIWDSSKV